MSNPSGTTRALGDPRRWAVTLGGLAAYGLGSRLWLPGLDPDAVTALKLPGLSADLSIFSVGVRPIVFGLAFVEMARVILPPLARWASGSRDHSERLWRTARILALALAAVQAMGMAQAIEGLDGVAPSPGPMFRLGVIAAIVGATAFLIWLARIMTERGVGDGLLVLFAAPLVAHLPYDAAAAEAVRTGLAAWAPRRWPRWLLRPSRFSSLRRGRREEAGVSTFGPRCWERSSSRRCRRSPCWLTPPAGACSRRSSAPFRR